MTARKRRPTKTKAAPAPGSPPQIHFVAGQLRSFSTGFCNLLNQRPDSMATSTSGLPDLVERMCAAFRDNVDFSAELHHDQEATERRMHRTVKGAVEGFYSDAGVRYVFHKNRAWGMAPRLVNFCWPDSKIIMCVRDPREVFASILRRADRFPLFTDGGPLGETIQDKAGRMFGLGGGPAGMLGTPIAHIENALRLRALKRPEAAQIVTLKFEDIVANPKKAFAVLYAELEMEPYAHDFKNIEDTAWDLDCLTRFLYPHHDSTGKLEDRGDTWQKWIPKDIADAIVKRNKRFCETFGYVE